MNWKPRQLTTEDVEAQYRQVLTLVQKAGHAAIHLAATPELSPVTFTVGGAAQDLPDLIIYGLGPDMGLPTINNAFAVLKNEWPFPNWNRSSDVGANFDIVFRDVSRSDLLQRAMFLTDLFNKRHGYVNAAIFQVCWPDDRGIFPFEPGCSPDIARAQRVRGLRS